MHIHKTTLLVACTTALMLTGCATIVSGTTQTVSVDSTPQGAKIYTAVKVTDANGNVTYLNKTEAGQTPQSVSIERKDGAILLEKTGYQPAEVPLHRGMAGWVWGDIVLLSLLSTSIDTSTGAAKEYDPDQYLVEMKAINK